MRPTEAGAQDHQDPYVFRLFFSRQSGFQDALPVIANPRHQTPFFLKTGLEIKIGHFGHDVNRNRLTSKSENIEFIFLQKPFKAHVKNGHPKLRKSLLQLMVIFFRAINPDIHITGCSGMSVKNHGITPDQQIADLMIVERLNELTEITMKNVSHLLFYRTKKWFYPSVGAPDLHNHMQSHSDAGGLENVPASCIRHNHRFDGRPPGMTKRKTLSGQVYTLSPSEHFSECTIFHQISSHTCHES